MTTEPAIFAELRTLPADQFLLLKVLAPTVVGSNNRTLLHEAIAFRRTELMSYLIERGVPVNHQNNKGQTALHYAAIYGSLTATQLLIESGADPNICDMHGNNALWAALSTHREPSIRVLLVRAGADATHKNKMGKSVLDFARQSQNQELWVLCGGKEADFSLP